uniref:Uncharacterized protein n=1 Tax=uncultured marine virus TaxID=186617 RepID=A0A0F7LA45_9VIRU|nr:hypothetical protein [uncultured marine virus]
MSAATHAGRRPDESTDVRRAWGVVSIGQLGRRLWGVRRRAQRDRQNGPLVDRLRG